MIINENLNKIYKIVLTIILVISFFLICLLFFYKPNYYKNKVDINNKSTIKNENKIPKSYCKYSQDRGKGFI